MFANLKIGSRLFLGFGLVLALLCVMAVVAAWQQGRLADAAAYYAENLVPSYETEHEAALALSDIRRFELRHVLANTDDAKDALERKMAERRKLIADHLDRYAQVLVSDDQDKRALEQVQQALAAYYAEWEKVRPLSRQTVTDPMMMAAATEQLLGASSKNYEATHEAIRRWWDYNVKLSKDQMVQAQSVANSAKAILGALTLAALVLGAAAAVLITRSIVRPIQQAVQLASTVADGDLTMRIEAHGKDEVAQLLQALSRMNDNLAGIVNRVRNSSDSIATGSTQIASGNADLSQRTEEQASNLQQTAASMEQLSGTVRSNAETAGHANELAAQASAAAVKGGEVVGSVVATMQDIANASKKISDIIGVIDGIAFQTNILALNAAVEAARAGEQGRGFAVVASEVRSLASRAADAAKEIKSLIGASVEKVEMGARQVHEAGSSMDEIVSQVQRVTAMISEISAATNEQSAGISQVGDAVTQLDQVTQQNAALVEESAAAAESLRHQAAQLTEVVGVFKVLQSADDMGHARSTAANAAVIERRSPSRPFTGAAAASKAAAPVQTAAKTGTDSWETF